MDSVVIVQDGFQGRVSLVVQRGDRSMPILDRNGDVERWEASDLIRGEFKRVLFVMRQPENLKCVTR